MLRVSLLPISRASVRLLYRFTAYCGNFCRSSPRSVELHMCTLLEFKVYCCWAFYLLLSECIRELRAATTLWCLCHYHLRLGKLYFCNFSFLQCSWFQASWQRYNRCPRHEKWISIRSFPVWLPCHCCAICRQQIWRYLLLGTLKRRTTVVLWLL
jgi:hypothetical protein